MPNAAAIFKEALQQAEKAQYLRDVDDAILAARENVNDFIEFCFGLVQAPIHRQLQGHWNSHGSTVDLFPIGHGKTTQVIGRIVWLLGKHPDRCMAYITSGERPALKVGRAVKRAIESNERVRLVFPDLKPEGEDDQGGRTWWGAQSMRVNGSTTDGLDKDPSLAVYGWNGQITGSRMSVIFIDNVCNRENTYSANMRDNVLETIENDILSREAIDGCTFHITDTSWYDDDPPHVLGARGGWDMHVVDAEQGEDGNTAWPEVWTWEKLAKKREEIGPIAYDRTLRNITTAMSAGIFKRAAWDQCLGAPWADSYDGPERVVTAVDLGTRPGAKHDRTVFTTGIRVDDVNVRVLHSCSLRATGTDIARVFVDLYRKFHNHAAGGEFVVEDNGAQVFIVDMLRNAATAKALGFSINEFGRLCVKGRTTTAKKHDLDVGVPALAGDLEMGRLMIPEHPEMAQLWEDMRVYTPEDHTGDHLMSLWILRESLKRPTADFMAHL